jgi:para-nitrobenzyl esterase
MGHHSPKSDRINRRSLLTGGVALAGGAALTLGISGQETPKTVAAKTAAPATSANMHPPVVAVRGGKLRGFKDGRILTFLGVPYAEAERFEMPRPVKAWEGTKSAQSWGPVCPHPEQTAVGPDDFVFPHRYWVENENCQVLNIWTQSTAAKTKKPVMVWMHGGGFTNGSSMESYAYDGRSLSEFGDVVVVSVNHRLNIIGTLDVSAYGAQYSNSRNTGMADLVAALEWIRENIEVFGGDPGNVTIFGQSGGGGKVTRLMHMPAAKGLFHKVICESGTPVNYRETNPAETIKGLQAVAAQTLKNLGHDGSQMDKVKKVPYRELLAAGIAANQTVASNSTPSWYPVADDVYVMREFCDWADSIPFIAGNVMSEFNSNLRELEFSKNEWTQKQIEDRLTAAYGDKKDDVVAEFRKVYPGKKVQDVLFVDSDNRFRRGTKTLLARKLEKTKAPVYNYIFTYEYQVNGGVTAWHCSEIAFVFHALQEPHVRLAAGDVPSALALQDKISQAWVNFARTGNPSQPGLAWKPYSLGGKETMIFDTVSAVRSHDDDRLQSLLPPTRG